MLNVVSSEPVSRDTKRSCVLRGSCTHCALKKALRWKSGAMTNYQVWSSITLTFWSNLKPWINLKESVSCNKSPFQWHLYIFIIPFSSFLWPQSPVMPQKGSYPAIKPCYKSRHEVLGSIRWKARDQRLGPGQKRQPSSGRGRKQPVQCDSVNSGRLQSSSRHGTH